MIHEEPVPFAVWGFVPSGHLWQVVLDCIQRHNLVKHFVGNKNKALEGTLNCALKTIRSLSG
jgi:hypothetical protein